MDVDWHYYLLIAPHSSSSPFEDQSGHMPLCVPTLINPVNFNKANCSLCTSAPPNYSQAEKVVEGESSVVQHCSGNTRDFRIALAKCGIIARQAGQNQKSLSRPAATSKVIGCYRRRNLASVSAPPLNFRHYKTQRMNESRHPGDMVKEQVRQLAIGWRYINCILSVMPLTVQFPQVCSICVSH